MKIADAVLKMVSHGHNASDMVIVVSERYINEIENDIGDSVLSVDVVVVKNSNIKFKVILKQDLEKHLKEIEHYNEVSIAYDEFSKLIDARTKYDKAIDEYVALKYGYKGNQLMLYRFLTFALILLIIIMAVAWNRK